MKKEGAGGGSVMIGMSNAEMNTDNFVKAVVWVKNVLEMKPALSFGKINKRSVQTVATDVVYQSYRVNGAEGRISRDHVINVVCEEKYLDASCLGPIGWSISEAKELVFSAEGQKLKTLDALGGQHRLQALAMYKKDVEQELARTRSALENFQKLSDAQQAQQVARGVGTEQEQEARISDLEKNLDRMCEWTLVIFYPGESYSFASSSRDFGA